MSEGIFQKLVDEYYAERPNLGVSHPPLCILFFACSGSGKSTTRKLLVEKLKATYVCNDEVRELMNKYPEAEESRLVLGDIVLAVVERIFAEAKNKFVVFDNNIIQYYWNDDSYLNTSRKNNRPVFMIGLEGPEELLRQRIIDRGVNVDYILGELPGQLKAYEKATHDIKPDWVIKNTGENEHDALIKYLELLLSKPDLLSKY